VSRRVAAITIGACFCLGALEMGSACSEFEAAAPDVTDAAEASVSDAGSGDAAADAPSSPCIGAEHFLCADFNADPYTKGWTQEDRLDGGTLTLDPSTSVSPPRSLAVAISASSGDPIGSSLQKRVAVTPTDITFSFALRVDTTANASVSVASVELGTSPGGDGVFLVMGGTPLEAQLRIDVVTHRDGGIEYELRPLAAIPTNEWHRLAFALSFPGGGEDGDLRVDLDGQTKSNAPVKLRAATQGARIGVGLGHYGPNYLAHAVHFDDVVLDVLPTP
jgi:hypothetical protein